MPNILHRQHSHGLGFSRKLSNLRLRSGSPSGRNPDILSSLKPIEEETLPNYDLNAFYPARIEDVLNDRYRLVAKLGYGVTATVWLAKDVHSSPGKTGQRYVAIKINVHTLTEDWLSGRREIANRLSTANSRHPGYQHVRFMLDTFKLKGPYGKHLCIVYNVLREPIDLCMDKWPGHLFNSDKLRILVLALLQGLDYMHAECQVVHTDLKADNIMTGLGDSTILERFAQNEADRPSPRKMPDSHGRIIYQSRSDFGDAPTDDALASAKITDIGLAEWGNEPQMKPIQSNAFTAPEVLLFAGWSYSADIWNFGVMLWDLFENFGLFDAIDTGRTHYSPEKHLGLMIALMGPPPKTLIDRGSKSPAYFDEHDQFRFPESVPKNFSFESSITRFRGDDKELFIDFAQKMVRWLPEERWSAKQLLQHPWLTRDKEAYESSASIASSRLASGACTPTTSAVSVKSVRSSATSYNATAVDPCANMSSEALIRRILER